MKAPAHHNKPRAKQVAAGPSLYEVEYLRQLKEELETFLRSRNISTLQELQVAFAGPGYSGVLNVSA